MRLRLLLSSGLLFLGVGCQVRQLPDNLDEVAVFAQQVMSDLDEAMHQSRLVKLESTQLLQSASLVSRATSCYVTQLTECSQGVMARNLSSCTASAGAFNLTGAIGFKAYDANEILTCTVADVKVLNRYPEYSATGKRREADRTITVTSQGVTAYDPEATFGTGETLTVSSGGMYTWSVDGLKRSVTDTTTGAVVETFSARTISPFAITGTKRSDTKVTSGSLEVYANTKQYLATLSFTDITFGDTCNEPTGGTVKFTTTEALVGTGTITFGLNCGSVAVTYADTPTNPKKKARTIRETVTSDSSNLPTN